MPSDGHSCQTLQPSDSTFSYWNQIHFLPSGQLIQCFAFDPLILQKTASGLITVDEGQHFKTNSPPSKATQATDPTQKASDDSNDMA
ncbi:unnamed protein product [Schistocephalus solidus]|uniref:Uncharacterized protein n=1 Tax=Schistocephalus solidus TaxID=70667 RepID=A0A183S8W1_SCHSO|nr:unnamed protein product [Schistocephalus solidus]